MVLIQGNSLYNGSSLHTDHLYRPMTLRCARQASNGRKLETSRHGGIRALQETALSAVKGMVAERNNHRQFTGPITYGGSHASNRRGQSGVTANLQGITSYEQK